MKNTRTKVSILGHFGGEKRFTDGQTVKTVNLYNLLKKSGSAAVCKIDTYRWTRNPLRLFKKIKTAFRENDSVIMLPAQNGVKLFAPILLHFKKKYSKKIFYDVIGGWLPEFLEDKPSLADKLKKFDGIWVETSTMKQKLEALNFSNVTVIPNFKELKILNENGLVYPEGTPLRLCTFSRVMKEKGIEDAVNSVKAVNEKLGYTALALDIYGAVDAGQTEWFENLKKDFPEYIVYRGVAKPEESVETVKNYFALLFPTRFYTEGIPGTIIDGYAAGVPVISARWLSFGDVVEEGKTGVGYEFGKREELEKILLSLTENPEILNSLKKNCLEKVKEFSPERATNEIAQKLGGGVQPIN